MLHHALPTMHTPPPSKLQDRMPPPPSDDIMVGIDPPACSLVLPALLEVHAHMKSLPNSERCFAMMVIPSRRS
jgi:hypothetical protein